jgi:hypothetical protein
MKKIILLLFIAVSLFHFSCNRTTSKYQTQVQITERLLQKLKKNEYDSIKGMIGVDLSDIGMNREILINRVQSISELLQKFQVGGQGKYKFKEYAKTDPLLVDIIIPIEEPNINVKEYCQVIVSFAKYLPKDKILNFELFCPIEKRLDEITSPTESPTK